MCQIRNAHQMAEADHIGRRRARRRVVIVMDLAAVRMDIAGGLVIVWAIAAWIPTKLRRSRLSSSNHHACRTIVRSHGTARATWRQITVSLTFRNMAS
jgi:hypothetical protein